MKLFVNSGDDIILFSLVNQQLSDAEVSFYAINGGNDLGGMFLTEAQVEQARRSLPLKSDWPNLLITGR